MESSPSSESPSASPSGRVPPLKKKVTIFSVSLASWRRKEGTSTLLARRAVLMAPRRVFPSFFFFPDPRAVFLDPAPRLRWVLLNSGGAQPPQEEYGSVASTPDSTPPYTDGGNEESELYELQTAHEWSEDEDGDIDEEDEGLGSSPSIWGTPRQNSFELSFSYFAIAEAEAAGVSRHQRERERRRTPSRSSRASLLQTDTLEMLLDSPDPEWDHPQAFLGTEEEEEDTGLEPPPEEEEGLRMRHGGGASAEVGAFLMEPHPEPRMEAEGGETEVFQPRPHHHTPLPPQREDPTQSHPAVLSAPEPQPAVVMETTSVKLLACVGPRGGVHRAEPRSSSSTSTAAGRHTQEQLASEHWFSALGLTEEQAMCFQIAAEGSQEQPAESSEHNTSTHTPTSTTHLPLSGVSIET
ncbi:hypothetical protein CRUP_024618 [Coryphaenoides rupestris]|nr:hypothetical protein CRUP_024618 [Coryphaenoides rupestris]